MTFLLVHAVWFTLQETVHVIQTATYPQTQVRWILCYRSYFGYCNVIEARNLCIFSRCHNTTNIANEQYMSPRMFPFPPFIPFGHLCLKLNYHCNSEFRTHRVRLETSCRPHRNSEWRLLLIGYQPDRTWSWVRWAPSQCGFWPDHWRMTESRAWDSPWPFQAARTLAPWNEPPRISWNWAFQGKSIETIPLMNHLSAQWAWAVVK